ncbi:MAG: hypothetical protein C5S38_07210 [Candidatus Methanophagaceae archaeon]|nr:MAG: hypothetical protein C5S38_07210 [Methanophagales archaeon]
MHGAYYEGDVGENLYFLTKSKMEPIMVHTVRNQYTFYPPGQMIDFTITVP